MRGYRIWPAFLLAVVGGVAAAAIAFGDAAALPDGDCADGSEWATVAVIPDTIIPDTMAGEDALLADFRQQFEPVLAGCLDVDDLAPAEVPDPRS